MLPRSYWTWTVLGAPFIVLALVFTYPVWTDPARVLNDLGDPRLGAWTLAWDLHALTDPGDRLFDANIFHPRGQALAISENLLGHLLIAAPFIHWGSPVLGYNAALVLGLMLTGLMSALWVRYLTGDTGAGIVAGAIAAFAPSRMTHLSHLQLFSMFWVPLALLLVTRFADRGRERYLFGAAAAMAAQYWSGIQVTLIFAPFVVLYAIALVRQRRPVAELPRALATAAAASGVFVLLVLPVSLPYLQLAAQGMERTVEMTQGISPLGYLSATYGRAPHLEALAGLADGDGGHFPGLTTLALIGLGAAICRNRRQRPDPARPVGWRHLMGAAAGAYLALLAAAIMGADTLAQALANLAPALILAVSVTAWLLAGTPRGNRLAPLFWTLLALALLGHLLSLGPVVTVGGNGLGPGPYRLLHELRPYQAIRAVGRFGLATSFFLAAAAGVAVAAWRSGRRPPVVVPALMLALVAEFWVAPLRVEPALPDASVDATIAGLPGDGAVLHLPINASRRRWDRTTEYMLGSSLHWRPLVNGYSGFLPPTLRGLAELRPLTPAFLDRLAAQAPVDYVVVHADGFSEQELRRVLQRAEASSRLRLLRELPRARIYSWRDRPHPTALFRRTFAAHQQTARGLEMELRGRGRVAGGIVQISWGTRAVADIELPADWTTIEVPAPEPADADPEGSFSLYLTALTETGRDPGQTGAALRANVLVDIQQGRAALAINDEWRLIRYAPALELFRLTADGSRLVEARGFDLHVDGVRDATAYLRLLPAGEVIAIAGFFNPSMHGFDALRAALAASGLDLPARDTGYRFAGVGVRGAASGTARGRASLGRAWMRVGPPVRRLPELMVRGLRWR